jgi:serine phosphatase RsbU (regulator of sigma subunit)
VSRAGHTRRRRHWKGNSDMLSFNAFTVHELVAFAVMAPLALLFYVIYWKLGRRHLDLLYALLVTCCAAVTLLTFLIENVVPTGTPAEEVFDGPGRVVLLSRIQYAFGLAVMALQLHFVFRYRGARNFFARHIGLTYALLLAAIPCVWSKWFLAPRLEPIASISSWRVAVPFFPEPGPLILPYVGLWLMVQATTLVLLYRPASRRSDGQESALPFGSLVRLSFVVLAATGLIDIILAGSGWAGIALIPVGAVLISLMVAAALIKGRLVAERHRQRLDRELEIASRIQQDLLPSLPPQVHGFELAGWSRPAARTGGDTYDFVPLPNGRWLIVLADATGHGVGPALIISETRAYLRALCRAAVRPSLILHGTDELLSEASPEDFLVTCFLGLLEPSVDTLSFASAGQGPILFFDHAEQGFRELKATCPPLGGSLLPAPNGWELRHQFQQGDFLVVVSDGFYEAVSARGEPFGLDRLKSSLLRHRQLSVRELIEAVWEDLGRFTGSLTHADDLTMVVLRKT